MGKYTPTKAVTLRINPDTIKDLDPYTIEGIKSKNKQMEDCIELFPLFRRNALFELKGIFTELELRYLITVFERYEQTLQSKVSVEMLIAKLKEGQKYQADYITQNGIDVERIIEKSSGLNTMHLFFLQDELENYHYNSQAYLVENMSRIDAFLAKFQ